MRREAGIDVLEALDTDSVAGTVKRLLSQSTLACEAGDSRLMLRIAENARCLAVRSVDQLGEAAALVHLGVAHARIGDRSSARRSIERAHRIYHREAPARQRSNEGLTLFVLATLLEPRVRLERDIFEGGRFDPKPLVMYEQAERLFVEASHSYAAEGDVTRFSLAQRLCDAARSRLSERVPQFVICGP